MRIQVKTQANMNDARTLTALIALEGTRKPHKKTTARTHPAWRDLERHFGSSDESGAYLATGEAPLLYLPASAAASWEDDEKLRILAGRAFDAACGRGSRTLVLPLDTAGSTHAAALCAEGIMLRAYRFHRYKKSLALKNPPTVILLVAEKDAATARKAVRRAIELAECTNRARDLVNEPGSVMTPAEVEKRARALARSHGLKCQVLSLKELVRQGYEGLETVGRGGAVPPRMIILKHEPPRLKKDAPHLGLLGKGVTFDTGGISIKPSSKMWEMKGDMAGAAAALHAIEAIARTGLPLRVTTVLVLAQNSVDAKSVLPGDIITARNGKTIHVDNTDAEGRLILSDGLWRMGEEKVTHLIDIATLTGACLRALGNAVSGCFGNDAFADRVTAAGGRVGEPCWRLPIIEEYRRNLDHPMADINNIGNSPLAGATLAALFLREFVPEGVHWTHLDIAGTFIADHDWKYYRPGATGIMVRTLHAVAEELAGA